MKKISSDSFYLENPSNNLTNVYIAKEVFVNVVYDLVKVYNTNSQYVKSVKDVQCKIRGLNVSFYIKYHFNKNIDSRFLKELETKIDKTINRLINISVTNIYFLII